MAATQDSSPEGFVFEPEYTEEELAKFENEYDTEAEFAEIEIGLQFWPKYLGTIEKLHDFISNDHKNYCPPSPPLLALYPQSML